MNLARLQTKRVLSNCAIEDSMIGQYRIRRMVVESLNDWMPKILMVPVH